MNVYGKFLPGGLHLGESTSDSDDDDLLAGLADLSLSAARTILAQEAEKRKKNSSKKKKKNSTKAAYPQFQDADIWNRCLDRRSSDSEDEMYEGTPLGKKKKNSTKAMNRTFLTAQEKKKKKNSTKAMNPDGLETDYDPSLWDAAVVGDIGDVGSCVRQAYLDGVVEGVRIEGIRQGKKKKNSTKAANSDFFVDTMAEQSYQTKKKKNSTKVGNPYYNDPWSGTYGTGYASRCAPRPNWDRIVPPAQYPIYGTASLMTRGVRHMVPTRGRVPFEPVRPGRHQPSLYQPRWGSMYW